jgi:hypothetical protein
MSEITRMAASPRGFDKPLWDHERQDDEDPQHDILGLLSEPPKAAGKTGHQRTAQERAADNEARQRRGDRQDWRVHIKPPLGSPYRLADEWTLTKRQKEARTLSIKKAIAKREKREPMKVPAYQRGERRVVYAKLVEQEQRRRAKIEALTVYGPYDIMSGPQTRAWEVELQRAVDWFMDTFGGPEHPEERRWREWREGFKPFYDAGLSGIPGWEWEVPEREDPDFYQRHAWSSPRIQLPGCGQ